MIAGETYPPSPEEAVLLNAAFVALVLFNITSAFVEEAGSGMDMPYAYMVPPVVLVKALRDKLPRNKTTSMAVWMHENREVRLGFDRTCSAFVPFLRSGLLFGLSAGALELNGLQLRPGRLARKASAILRANTDEVRVIVKAAGVAGRWYAHAADLASTMSLWGIRP